MDVGGKEPKTRVRRPYDMNSKDNMNALRQAIAKFPRGKWHSPDTTTKKENWYVSVAQGQAVGMPAVGDLVWVSKSRGAYQVVELTEAKGDHVDNVGIARVLYSAKVVAEL
jgi:hypothetical protein